MQQAPFPRRRRNGDVGVAIGRKPPGYSRYTDPEIFPRFGGDEFDPPPYATGRRSTVSSPLAGGPRRGIMREGLAMVVDAVLFLVHLLFRKLSAPCSFFMFPR
jgi:hypothetical protein